MTCSRVDPSRSQERGRVPAAVRVGYLRGQGGMIGSLSHLIREAALDALLDGTEKITRAGLDAVDLDQAAEEPHAIRTRRRHAAKSA